MDISNEIIMQFNRIDDKTTYFLKIRNLEPFQLSRTEFSKP